MLSLHFSSHKNFQNFPKIFPNFRDFLIDWSINQTKIYLLEVNKLNNLLKYVQS